jgi:hypothetical protein
MVIYIALGVLQGLIHEVLRQAVILRRKLFWWDIPGRIGTYFIYIFAAAILAGYRLVLDRRVGAGNFCQPYFREEEIIWMKTSIAGYDPAGRTRSYIC